MIILSEVASVIHRQAITSVTFHVKLFRSFKLCTTEYKMDHRKHFINSIYVLLDFLFIYYYFYRRRW